MADQVCHCFKALDQAVVKGQLLPLNPPLDQPAADMRHYLGVDTAQAINDAFFDQVVAPFLANFHTLLIELPDFELHLRQHLLDRVLIHLGELLKARDRAWRAAVQRFAAL